MSRISFRVEQIEALELVGASFANDKDNYDVGMAYRFLLLIFLEYRIQTCGYILSILDFRYLERGMRLRWDTSVGGVVEKEVKIIHHNQNLSTS